MDNWDIDGVRQGSQRFRYAIAAVGLGLLACGGAPPSTTTSSSTDAPAAEPSARYEIRIDRPEHVGQRWHVQLVGRQSRTRQSGERGPEITDLIQIELSAVVEILEVDPEGRQLRLEYRIERLVSAQGQQPRRPLASPGSVITVIRGEAPVIQIDGEVVPEELRRQLDIVVETGVDRNDDLAFGTREPRAVGDSWGLNTEATRRAMREAGFSFDTLAGRMRLERVVDIGGEPCLELRGHLTLGGIRLPNLSEHIRDIDASMHMSFEGAYPLDPLRHERWERAKVTNTVEIPLGGTQLRTVQTREVRRVFQPLPDANGRPPAISVSPSKRSARSPHRPGSSR